MSTAMPPPSRTRVKRTGDPLPLAPQPTDPSAQSPARCPAPNRLGRNNAIGNLIKYSFRASFGLGRGPKAKILPMLATAIVFLPAIVQVGVLSIAGGLYLINRARWVELMGDSQLVRNLAWGSLALLPIRPGVGFSAN